MTNAMDRARRALAGSLLLLLASCTSVQYQADHLDGKIGLATREEVVASLGPPQDAQDLEGGGERWIYRYSYTSIGGTAVVGRRTCWENVLTFDQHGILRARERREC